MKPTEILPIPTPYDAWKADPTPDNMSAVLDDLDPVITREVHRYPGPSALLRSKAKHLALAAVKSYKSDQGAALKSWVVTQLQPLTRYGQQLRPVYVPEVTNRQSAMVADVRSRLSEELGRDPSHEELADETGFNVRKVKRLIEAKPAILSESQLYIDPESGMANLPAASEPDVVGESAGVVYDTLSDRDKSIYDMRTGKHGKAPVNNLSVARKLKVSPAFVSQRAKEIAQQILEGQKRVL